jgi:hypothetical protein
MIWKVIISNQRVMSARIIDTISKTRFRAIEGVSSHRRALEPIEPIAAIDLHSTGQNKGLL